MAAAAQGRTAAVNQVVQAAAAAVASKAVASFCSPCSKEVTHHHQVGVLKVQR